MKKKPHYNMVEPGFEIDGSEENCSPVCHKESNIWSCINKSVPLLNKIIRQISTDHLNFYKNQGIEEAEQGHSLQGFMKPLPLVV